MDPGQRLPLPLPRHARARPNQPALVADGVVVTYEALAAEVDETALKLAGLGLVAGDRLAVWLPNGRAFAVLLHATARLGVVLVPLNTRLTAPELAWQLADSGPRLAVWDEVGDDSARSDIAEGAGLDVAIADRPDRAGVGGSAAGGWSGRWLGLAALAEASPADVGLLDEVDLTAPATLVYTSGTTGRPKGAVLTHGNHLWSALASAQRLGVLPADRWLLPLPLFHVGGLAVLLRSALYGTTAELHQRFDAGAVAAALAGGDVTLASLVPTMLGRVLDVWDGPPLPSTFRAALLGGGPVPIDLLRRAAAAGIPVAPTYGLTEACSQVATRVPALEWPDDDVDAEPLAFTSVRIAGDDGRLLSAGQVGEIQVRGPTVMSGYWRDPAATAAALVDGWLRTGDAGWLDGQGRLHVADRRDDLIVSGGENVYPAEVEAVLDAQPGVAESCVIGLPDETWGHVVAAVVVRTAPDLTAEDLVAVARRHLAGYKVPRRVIWAESLPRTAAGKLRRAQVRAGALPDRW